MDIYNHTTAKWDSYSTANLHEWSLVQDSEGTDPFRLKISKTLEIQSTTNFECIVTTCCLDSKRKQVMGNIRENSLTEIWNKKKYQEMRKLHRSGRFHEIDECRNCGLANYRKEEN